jgi:hypothetical protein
VTGNGSVTFGGVLSLDFSGGLVTDGTDVLQLFANAGGVSGARGTRFVPTSARFVPTSA